MYTITKYTISNSLFCMPVSKMSLKLIEEKINLIKNCGNILGHKIVPNIPA